MEKVTVNGISLAYERRGQGKPLVLIHGYPLDHTIWEEVATRLEDAFDLILPDLRGFGESSTVSKAYTMYDIASDLAGLLDHLGIQRAALAGHSMGGYVALAFARLFPERVNGLALIASQVLADPPERREARYAQAAQVAEQGSGVVTEMAQKLTQLKPLQSTLAQLIGRQSVAGIVGALKAMAEREDSSLLLPTFSFPLVLVHGNADALIPVERAREVKAMLPTAHFVELAGGGHMPMLEAPEKTAEALRLLAQ
ncbi:MAG: alpha/beta fold hydrolase [Anaerolineae bacterium]